MSEATKQRIKKAIENTGYIPSAQAQAMIKKFSYPRSTQCDAAE